MTEALPIAMRDGPDNFSSTELTSPLRRSLNMTDQTRPENTDVLDGNQPNNTCYRENPENGEGPGAHISKA